MPYRRLPKTDQARLRALKQAIQHAGEVEFKLTSTRRCLTTSSIATRCVMHACISRILFRC